MSCCNMGNGIACLGLRIDLGHKSNNSLTKVEGCHTMCNEGKIGVFPIFSF